MPLRPYTVVKCLGMLLIFACSNLSHGDVEPSLLHFSDGGLITLKLNGGVADAWMERYSPIVTRGVQRFQVMRNKRLSGMTGLAGSDFPAGLKRIELEPAGGQVAFFQLDDEIVMLSHMGTVARIPARSSDKITKISWSSRFWEDSRNPDDGGPLVTLVQCKGEGQTHIWAVKGTQLLDLGSFVDPQFVHVGFEIGFYEVGATTARVVHTFTFEGVKEIAITAGPASASPAPPTAEHSLPIEPGDSRAKVFESKDQLVLVGESGSMSAVPKLNSAIQKVTWSAVEIGGVALEVFTLREKDGGSTVYLQKGDRAFALGVFADPRPIKTGTMFGFREAGAPSAAAVSREFDHVWNLSLARSARNLSGPEEAERWVRVGPKPPLPIPKPLREGELPEVHSETALQTEFRGTSEGIERARELRTVIDNLVGHPTGPSAVDPRRTTPQAPSPVSPRPIQPGPPVDPRRPRPSRPARPEEQAGEGEAQRDLTVTRAWLAERMEHVHGMSERLAPLLPGQAALNTLIEDSLGAHYANQRLNKKPASLLIVSAPGMIEGKVGPALAETLYGNAHAIREISLANVTDAKSLGNVLNPTKGFLGSNSESLLEQALFAPGMENGGVIVFNSFSSLGSAEPSQRTSLVDQFTPLISSGQFFSTATNENLELGKYTFVFLANDAAKLMAGASSDRIRAQRFQKNSDPDTLKSLLMIGGTTGKFISEQSVVAMLKPSTEEEAHAYLQNLALPRLIREIHEGFGADVEFTPDLSRQIVDHYFSSATGLPFLDDVLRQVEYQITKVLTAANRNRQSMPHLSVSLSESLNSSQLRETHLQIQAQGVVLSESNFSRFEKVERARGMDTDRPLESPQLLARLEAFPAQLSGRLKGQPEIVQAVTEIVTTKYMNPKVTDESASRPGTIMVVGPTGGGKTEGAKVTNELLTGRTDLEPIKMGDVQSLEDVAKVFGDAVNMGSFERLLQSGHVVVPFDEISNAGANDLRVKNAIYKLFYDITDEGRWTSPTTGIQYDLSRKILWFTGNDSEELFNGVTSDALRTSIYHRYSARRALNELLVRQGAPKAFIGRIGYLHLQKPTAISDIAIISERFLGTVLKELNETYPGISFRYEQGFASKMAKAFYNNDEGFRSVRSSIENSTPSAVGLAILQTVRQSHGLPLGSDVEIQLRDNDNGLPYYEGRPAKRRVEIVVSIRNSRDVKDYAHDVTFKATPTHKLSLGLARTVGIHEIGHYLANDEEATGNVLDFITIEPYQDSLGSAEYSIAFAVGPGLNLVIAKVAALLGGKLAEDKLGLEETTGWARDEVEIEDVIGQYLNLVARKAPPEDRQKLHQEIFEEAERRAHARLDHGWPFSEAILRELMQKGTLRREEIEAIMSPSSHGTALHATAECQRALGVTRP